MDSWPKHVGANMTDDRPRLHHVVFAVARDRHAEVARMFTELGFSFDDGELTELGLNVSLDWAGGLELISAAPDSTAEVATFVKEFVNRHGDGVYTVVLRVPDASAAESVTERYGSNTRFRQGFSGDGSYLDEIDLSVFGLPLTFLATNVE
jgi:4-hydroxyphenylpyruvate dioxygenase-like putative hemolysin